jgi:hypothetical protein
MTETLVLKQGGSCTRTSGRGSQIPKCDTSATPTDRLWPVLGRFRLPLFPGGWFYCRTSRTNGLPHPEVHP